MHRDLHSFLDGDECLDSMSHHLCQIAAELLLVWVERSMYGIKMQEPLYCGNPGAWQIVVFKTIPRTPPWGTEGGPKSCSSEAPGGFKTHSSGPRPRVSDLSFRSGSDFFFFKKNIEVLLIENIALRSAVKQSDPLYLVYTLFIFSPLQFITGCWIQFPVLYSRILFICNHSFLNVRLIEGCLFYKVMLLSAAQQRSAFPTSFGLMLTPLIHGPHF